MTEYALVVRNGALYVDNGSGVFADDQRVAGVSSSAADSGLALNASVTDGAAAYEPGDQQPLTMTSAGALRVEATAPVNPWAGSAWGGLPRHMTLNAWKA